MHANSFIHYKIHIEERDKEHERLFSLIREGTEMISSGKTDDLRETLLQLVTAVTGHFMHEKIFMENVKFPYLLHHLAVHKKILDKLEYLIKQFESEHMYQPYGRLSAKYLLSDFDHLLSTHVDHDDRQYAEFTLKSITS